MSGPMRNPGKPYSRHRSGGGTGGLLMLQATCDLPVPDLPPGREWSQPEVQMWEELWTGPQANQWDDSFIPVVAMFVTHCSNILGGRASAWMAQEARHLSDRLGLTPQGMVALGWELPPQHQAPASVTPLRGA